MIGRVAWADWKVLSIPELGDSTGLAEEAWCGGYEGRHFCWMDPEFSDTLLQDLGGSFRNIPL